MGRTGELAEHIATHEYTHLIADHAGLRYPPWLNEGLAELFSTFTIMNGSIAIGDPIPERILALREDRWVPLATIMAADRNSPYYNESARREACTTKAGLPCITSVRPKNTGRSFPRPDCPCKRSIFGRRNSNCLREVTASLQTSMARRRSTLALGLVSISVRRASRQRRSGPPPPTSSPCRFAFLPQDG